MADRAVTADHIYKDATDRYALLLFERAIVNIGDFYYCVVLTILNVIPNGITCIYKILEINKNVRHYIFYSLSQIKKLLPFRKVSLQYEKKNGHGQICNKAFMPLWPSGSVWRHGGGL